MIDVSEPDINELPPEVIKVLPVAGKDASFSSRKGSGWEVSGNNIYSTKIHSFADSFSTNEFIQYPGEYFQFHSSKDLIVLLTSSPEAMDWNVGYGVFLNYPYKGRYVRFREMPNNKSNYFNYRNISFSKPSLFSFGITSDGNQLVIGNENSQKYFSLPTQGQLYAPKFHLYGIGARGNLGIKEVKIFRKVI